MHVITLLVEFAASLITLKQEYCIASARFGSGKTGTFAWTSLGLYITDPGERHVLNERINE